MIDNTDVEFLRWLETVDRSTVTRAERLAVVARLQLLCARSQLAVRAGQAELVRRHHVPALGVTRELAVESYLREFAPRLEADPLKAARDVAEALEFERRPLLRGAVRAGRVPLHLAEALVQAGPGLREALEAGLVLRRREAERPLPWVSVPGVSRRRTGGRRAGPVRAA